MTYKQHTSTTKGRVFYTDTFYAPIPLPKDAVLVEKGGVSAWKKVFCGCRMRNPIPDIQLALEKKGYYKGEIDGVISRRMRKALKKFQKDNGLPIGSFDLQTLKALGININN